jgi:ketosteroid isomerase-like protein
MIGRLLIWVCSLLFVAGIAAAQERPLPALPEGVKHFGDEVKIKAVLAREEEMRQAYLALDQKRVTEFYSDDYLALRRGNACCVATKDDQIRALVGTRDARLPSPFLSIENDQVVVRVHGDTAVVTGVQVVSALQGGAPPQPVTVRVLFMDVWSLQRGKWMLIGGSHKIV